MKRGDSKFGVSTVIGCAILLLYLAGPGYCQVDGTALMLEISPVNGGTLSLSPGVHTYDRDAEVTLTAVPKPGFQFVYWLGDVTDATASTTMVFLDSPKIIIAVFERSRFELVEMEEEMQGSAGRGGLIASAGDYARGGISPITRRRPPKYRFPEPPKPKEDFPVPEEGPDFPVPEGGGDVPVPVPEPATLVFIFTGMLPLVKCRRRMTEVHRQTL